MKKTLLSLCLIFGIAFFISASLFAQDAFVSLSPTFSGKWESSANSYEDNLSVEITYSSGSCDATRDDMAPYIVTSATNDYLNKNCSINTSLNLGKPKDTKEKLGYKIGVRFPNFRVYYTSHSWGFKTNESTTVSTSDSLADGNYEIKETNEINTNLVFVDYLHQLNNLEFFIGVGIGTGQFKSQFAQTYSYSSVVSLGPSTTTIPIPVTNSYTIQLNHLANGRVTAYNVGGNYNITENFKIGLGYLSLSFVYDIDDREYVNSLFHRAKDEREAVIVARSASIFKFKESTLKRNTFFLDLTYSF